MSPVAVAFAPCPKRSPQWTEMASGTALAMWVFAIAAALFGGTFAIGTAQHGAITIPGVHQWTALAVWVCILPVPGQAWRTLLAQHSVYRGRAAPRAPLTWVASAYRRTVLGTLAIGILPLWLMAGVAPPSAGWSGFALLVAALMLVTVAACTLASAAWHGHIHDLWVLPA